MELTWRDRQRAFQARVIADPDTAVHLRAYRTFHGPAIDQSRYTSSRLERAAVVVIAGAAIVIALMFTGVAREMPALVAGLTGGIALVAGLAGPDPKHAPTQLDPVLAVYDRLVTAGDPPACVTEITPDEMEHLPAEGYAVVVGTPRPGGTLGLFVDDYIVWARTPPRGNRRDDPRFGASDA